MLIFLQRNLAWMVLAVALATSLWVVVTTQQNPDEVDFFEAIPVEPRNQPTGLVLRSEIPPIRLRVAAPRDVWQELRKAKFQATVDLARLGPGLQEVPIQVNTVESRARIEDVVPARALVHLERVRTKEVPVKVNRIGEPPTGFRAGTPRLTPELVVASGPESLIEQVVAAVADVDLANATASISQVARVSPQNGSGERVDRITLSSENVLVEVRIDQERANKTVPVQPQTAGSIAPGYWIAGLRADPSSVTIEGLPAALDGITLVPTRPVELNNATGDVSSSVELQLPEGVRLTRAQPVTVQVFVSPVEGSKVVEIAPTVKDVGAGLRSSISPAAVRLTVIGPMPILSGLGPREVQVSVNAAGLTPGTHQIRPQIELPPAPSGSSPLRVQQTEPERVELRIQAIEPTPTPPPATPAPTRTATTP
jgi:YbbR domain-containing protein